MATTKQTSTLHNNASLTAGGGNQNGTAVDLTVGYGAAVSVSLTNGATAPTVPAQVQLQTSPDNSTWFNFGGPLRGGTTNSEAVSWGGIEIPIGIRYFRAVAGSNTGQAVTVNVVLSQVTSV